MTLHTVEVTLKPDDAVNVLQGIADRAEKEAWTLMIERFTNGAVQLQVYCDGSDTAQVIYLAADGTWRMTDHISLGAAL